MEFLRYGSSIPGEYWGCCAFCIIQNFKQSPDTKASIQLVSGDGGGGITRGGELAFAGPTLKDIFETRIRIGTFADREMQNHGFLAILEENQCKPGNVGYEWLKILKANGFEFIRCVDNSVWSPKKNYLFGLFRNISGHRIPNPFMPPKAWLDLDPVVPEAFCADVSSIEKQKTFADQQTKAQKEIWAKGKTSIKTESEIVKAGAPVIMAGLRTEFPPETKAKREEKLKAHQPKPSAGTQHLYNTYP